MLKHAPTAVTEGVAASGTAIAGAGKALGATVVEGCHQAGAAVKDFVAPQEDVPPPTARTPPAHRDPPPIAREEPANTPEPAGVK